MGAAASSSSSAASSAGTAVLLASTRSVAGVGGGARWAAVTDGTARGGDTVLSIVEDAAVATGGALRLQGSLGALEGQGGRLVGFAIADCGPVDPALAGQSVGTQGLRLSYRHDPPDAHFQLRLLSKGLAPQESFVALLPKTPQGSGDGGAPTSSSTTTTTTTAAVIVPWSSFRLQYRGRPLADRAGERVDPSALTSIGVEITRSSQPPPLYARVPLPFDFTLFAPGIEAVP